MFVLTLKWSKRIALLVVVAIAVLLCAIIFSIGSGGSDAGPSVSSKVKTNEDR